MNKKISDNRIEMSKEISNTFTTFKEFVDAMNKSKGDKDNG